MKLTRITKLRHRLFRDFAWPGNLEPFSQFNVIYGWNGCGKTTLSSLLSLVEKRTALADGEAELEFDGTTKISGVDLASKPVPLVRVFNRDFVNATLSSVGDMAPIYFLGEDTVEKQKQVEQLRNELERVNAEVDTATSAHTAAMSKLDDFCKDKAKQIKELLTTAYSQTYINYDKRRFGQAARALSEQSAAAGILTEEEKVLLRSQKDGQPKSDIAKVVEPSIDIAALTQEVDELAGRSVVAQKLDELTTNARLASWVREGLSLHSGEHATDTCQFCLQSIGAARRATLEAHFNDAFEAFQRDVVTLVAKLNTAQQRVSSLQLPDPSRFYSEFTSDVTTASGLITAAGSATITALDVLISRVQAKRDNPFASSPSMTRDGEPMSAIGDAVAGLNAIVDRHNQTTTQFRKSVQNACKKLEGSYVAEAHAEFLRLDQAVDARNAALQNVKGEPTRIKEQIHALESQILEHQRPADELTRELRDYLGRDELQFEVKGTGYALTRYGQPVSNLSEGERTAISFLYFLKSLQDKTFDMERGIVVIDDPVSSLDANALFSAFGYMKERTKKCGQLFIFTHSFQFFRNVKNWFHYINRYWKKLGLEREPSRFYLLRAIRHTDGTRTGQLGPLDPLLREHDSEYQYLFRRVYDEAHRGDIATLEHHYDLPNVARRLLESFLAFRFPDEMGDNKLHRSLERVAFDEAKKTRILRLLNTYSHAGAISEPEHDLSLLAETQPILLDVLEMMKLVDLEHYQGLENLMNAV